MGGVWGGVDPAGRVAALQSRPHYQQRGRVGGGVEMCAGLQFDTFISKLQNCHQRSTGFK